MMPIARASRTLFGRPAAVVVPVGGPGMVDPTSETGDTVAARAAYVSEVRQLVEDQIAALFRLVSAAAARASTDATPIAVTREARSLTAIAGERVAICRIEAITDRVGDLDHARGFLRGQARCTVPTADGPAVEWDLVLQRVGADDVAARHTWRHTWMDARAGTPVTEATAVSALRSVFA